MGSTVFESFFELQEVEVAKKSPFQYFAAFFICLSVNISFQANKIVKMAKLFYMLFFVNFLFILLVVFAKIELEISLS